MNAKTKRRMVVVTGIIVIVLVVILAVVGGTSSAKTVSVAEAVTELCGSEDPVAATSSRIHSQPKATC
ncbi:MAG: hypothetical protein ACLTMP_09175 [Eggerthella lenta]